MIIKSFMETAQIDRVVDVADILGVTRQYVYNCIKDDKNIKLSELGEMVRYLEKNAIIFTINYDSQGSLYFDK
tara:strand:- start:659 stop:877 length:219 start_codon:yes stop_codon:yes gene_type:complete